jgi:uncharacterized protein (DUF488 family)
MGAAVVGMLFTIGYERRTPKQLALRLHEAQVERVVDVRAVPRSAKPGFSKGPLARALGGAGLEYLHLEAAGNPFHEEAARDLAAALARYREHLAAHPEVVPAVLAAAAGRRSALLCAEGNPARCHRSVLCEAIATAHPELAIVHL